MLLMCVYHRLSLTLFGRFSFPKRKRKRKGTAHKNAHSSFPGSERRTRTGTGGGSVEGQGQGQGHSPAPFPLFSLDWIRTDPPVCLSFLLSPCLLSLCIHAASSTSPHSRSSLSSFSTLPPLQRASASRARLAPPHLLLLISSIYLLHILLTFIIMPRRLGGFLPPGRRQAGGAGRWWWWWRTGTGAGVEKEGEMGEGMGRNMLCMLWRQGQEHSTHCHSSSHTIHASRLA